MRKDIAKVICEKERYKGGHSLPRKGRDEHVKKGATTWPFNGESLSPYPFKEGMKKKFGNRNKYKSFNDFLSPLRGFLRKSIGRKWNDIYSELAKSIPKGPHLNQHVWGHIMDDVEIHTRMIDGKVCVSDEFKRTWVPIEEKYHGWKRRPELYVHPVSGILLEVDHSKQKAEQAKREKQQAEEKYSNLRELRRTKTSIFWAVKIKDVWFEVEVRQKPAKVQKFYKNLDGSYKLDENGALMGYWERPPIQEVDLQGYLYNPPQYVPKKSIGKNGKLKVDWKPVKEKPLKYTPPTNEETYYASKRTLSHKELKKYKLI